jgi:hypothetical protein
LLFSRRPFGDALQRQIVLSKNFSRRSGQLFTLYTLFSLCPTLFH